MEIAALFEFFKASTGVVTDSRKVTAGALFFALKGENFDGNRFAAAALDKGAIAAVVDDEEVVKHEKFLLVKDVLKALQDLATYYRKQFHIPIIAITGSNGKTTTKNLVAAVLGSHYNCYFTKGNYNNHIGVPLTLLQMPQSTEVAVIEMGANHQGEIKNLCEIALPTHGLITNIGKAHLEGFGGVEGIKKGKGEMYQFLASNNGVIFLNEGEPHLMEVAKERASNYKKVIGYSEGNPDQVYRAKLLRASPYLLVEFMDESGRSYQLESSLFGKYNFQNLLTAIVLGKYFKVPGEKIKSGIEGYIPSENRSQVLEYKGGKIYLDAYNANPTSMLNAIRHFGELEADAKIIILGDMLELGEYEEEEHRKIVEELMNMNFEKTLLIGRIFQPIALEYDIMHVQKVEDAMTWWQNQDLTGKLVLIKGSRGMQLEKLLGDQKGH